MIVPMKHLTLLCIESKKAAALSKLGGLGVLHVETTIADSASMLAARAGVEEAQRAVSVVQAAAGGDWQQLSFKAATSQKYGDAPLVREINELADRYNVLREECRMMAQEIKRYEPWGDFDPAVASSLAASGLEVSLFKARADATMPVLKSGHIDVLSIDKIGAYGVVIGAPLPEGLVRVAMPEQRLSVLEGEYQAEMAKLQEMAESLAGHETDLDKLQAVIRHRGEFGDYVMVFDNMLIAGPVAHISGFIDARKRDEITEEAARNGWGVALRDPEPGENVPTLLEPPKLFRPITGLFKGLGILPGYNETDVSVPFYIFFTIFFAMLIGDAGYGALIILLTLFARYKVGKKSKEPLSKPVKSIFTLFYVFGGCTIAYGILSGAYFAIPQSYIPGFLRFKSIAWLGDINHIMQLCFTIGAVHLSIARIWNAVALFPSKKFLAEVGWVGVIWCMYCVVCSIVVEGFIFPSWGVPAMIVSVLLIVLFMLDISELKENGVNLGMLPLNIMSCMGDIISYVRLYAVGLASLKVAENFNMMATQIDLPMVFKLPILAVVLLFGHGLNFAMGALSILVHAVRLNTLEFSGAKGVSWSGRPFKPFKSTLSEPVTAVERQL